MPEAINNLSIIDFINLAMYTFSCDKMFWNGSIHCRMLWNCGLQGLTYYTGLKIFLIDDYYLKSRRKDQNIDGKNVNKW